MIFAARGMPTLRENLHKWTASDAAAHLVPRGHREHHDDREHIEEDEPKGDGAHGARNGLFGLQQLRQVECRRGDESTLIVPKLVQDLFPPRGIDAKDLIAQLDAAGIQRAIVLSVAYSFSNPNKPTVPDEYAHVIAENDWSSAQVAKYPDRLIGFCSVNPLRSQERLEARRGKLQHDWYVSALEGNPRPAGGRREDSAHLLPKARLQTV